MSSVGSTVYETEYREPVNHCPFCNETIAFIVEVTIKETYIRKAGSVGNQANFAVHFSPEITKVTTKHECKGPPKEGK